MPITLRVLLVVAATVAAALFGRAVLSRFLLPARVAEAQSSAEMIMEALAAIYGVLVAFLLAGAWGRFDDARGTLALEFNALAQLQQLAQLLPAPVSTEVGGGIEAYCVSVREELAHSPKAYRNSNPTAAIDRMLNSLAHFEPRTAGESVLQTQAFGAVNDLGDQRRVRLLAQQRTLPPIVWVVLVGGAMAVLGLAAISNPGGKLSAVYLALLAAVVSLALYTTYALSYPVRSGLTTGMAPVLEQVLERGAVPVQR